MKINDFFSSLPQAYKKLSSVLMFFLVVYLVLFPIMSQTMIKFLGSFLILALFINGIMLSMKLVYFIRNNRN